jgi:hypothetical protein
MMIKVVMVVGKNYQEFGNETEDSLVITEA